MVKMLEPLIKEIPALDLSEKGGFLLDLGERQEIKEGCYSLGCFSCDGGSGCYSCVSCYSTD